MQSRSEFMLPPEGHIPPPPEAVEPPVAPAPLKQSLHADTPIQTATGVQCLHSLNVGDKVRTRSGAYASITRIESVTFTKRQLHDTPEAAPVRFDPGALPGTPEEIATLVSPDCPIALPNATSELERFPARAFCDGGLIRSVIPDDGIHYIRLHFATVQQVCVGGIWVELSPEASSRAPLKQRVPQLVQDIRIFRPLPA